MFKSLVDAPSAGERAAVDRPSGHGSAGRGAVAVLVVAAAGCGGIAVVDPEPAGEGGSGGAPASTTTTSSIASSSVSASSSTSTGVGGFGGEGGAPSLPPLVEEDIGEIPIGGTIAFEVPRGTLGFTAVATVTSPGVPFDPVGIRDIVGPDGASLVREHAIPGTAAAFFNYGIGLAAVPQSSADAAMPLRPGLYEITVGDGGFGSDLRTARLTVWRRQTRDGRFHGGRLDVNVFIAGNAAREAYVTNAVRTAFQGFVGLSLGDVRVSRLGSEWEIIDGGNLPLVFEQTAGAEGKPALNIIAVSGLTGELEGAAGVTPAAPAFALEHGTHVSGIVVTLFEAPQIDTIILRHELGHFSGLFHTTEFDPTLADALDDTAVCDDPASLMERCPDYSNLMFPTGGDLSSTITGQQVTVMQASTFYRGIVEEGGSPAPPLALRPDGGSADPSTPAGAAEAEAEASAKGAAEAEAEASAKAESRHAPPRRGEAWATGLPPLATRLLAGHFCGHTALRMGSFSTLLRSVHGLGAGRLLALGVDASAPVQARARALAVAGRLSPARAELTGMAAVAEDRSLPRSVRLGALQGVAAASPAAARALAARLEADPDPSLRQLAERVAR